MSLQRTSDRVGQMRHRLSVQGYNTTRNEVGEEIIAWSEIRKIWAMVIHQLSSDETEQAQRNTEKVVVRFRARYRDDIDEKMKIRWKNKDWDIKSILPDNLLEYMELECEYHLQ